MSDSDALRYRDATALELAGLKKKCISLIPKRAVPSGQRIYHASVNWTTKFTNGAYTKTKCRACFAGNTFDKTYTDCYAPVCKFISVLIILCLSAMMGWTITGLDYEMAYLNAPLAEPCYMRAPTCMREFDDHGCEPYWRCDTCIYGHPVSGARWSQHLAQALTNYGFHQLRSDNCVFTIWKDALTFAIVVCNVDDCIIASNSSIYGDEIRHDLLGLFPGTDLGQLNAFCGIQIHHTDGGLAVSLRHYIDSFAKFLNTDTTTNRHTVPLTSRPLKADYPQQSTPWVKARYLKLTGMLIWIFSHCRLDLAFPIHAVTRVMHNPSEYHLEIIHNLCRYVCATAHWSLHFKYARDIACAPLRTIDFIFYTFCDSSYADDPETMCSTFGHFIFLGTDQGAICGKFLLGKNPAISSTEAEYCERSRKREHNTSGSIQL
jgi:hypothetical protein